MEKTGTLFGWAFGDVARADEPGYVEELRREALKNASQDAARRGFKVQSGEESYAVLQAGETLVDVENAQTGSLSGARLSSRVRGRKAFMPKAR